MTSSVTPTILLYDPIPGGHHAEYIAHLVRFRHTFARESTLIVALSQSLLDTSPELTALLNDDTSGRLQVELVSDIHAKTLKESTRLQAAGFEAVVRRTRPSHAIGMYGDHLQLGLALGLRFEFAVSLYGILFRPTFHYREFGERTEGMKAALRHAMKRLLLHGALRNRHFRSFFTLDPLAARSGREIWGPDRFVHLPDPVEAFTKSAWSWPDNPGDGRKALLVFGVLDDRKGLVPLFDAIDALPKPDRERLCLQMAGTIPGGMQHIRDRIEKLRESSGVRIMLADERIPDDLIQSLIGQSDLVSLLYQREHVGSSGVLLRAAGAGIPVLATDRGLIGHYVDKYRLGIAVDSEDPDAIGAALQRWLNGESIQWDREIADSFAKQHTPEAFARTVYQSVTGGVGHES